MLGRLKFVIRLDDFEEFRWKSVGNFDFYDLLVNLKFGFLRR